MPLYPGGVGRRSRPDRTLASPGHATTFGAWRPAGARWHHKSRLMVVDDGGRLAGVLSLADLVTAAADMRALETLRRIAEREARAALH